LASAKPRALTVGRSLVAEQIAYHESRLARVRDAGERIGLLSEAFFGMTLLVALVKFLGALDKFGHVLEWGNLSGAFLSAAAGAFVGIRAYAEFSLLARQSAFMLRILKGSEVELTAAGLIIDQPLASQQLGRTLYTTTTAMMQDITGWAHLFRIKTIEVG
jgi:hypothetical protein